MFLPVRRFSAEGPVRNWTGGKAGQAQSQDVPWQWSEKEYGVLNNDWSPVCLPDVACEGGTVAGNKAGGMEPVWWVQSRGLHPPGDSVLAFLIMHSISFVWDSPQVYVHLNGVLQFMGSQRVGHDWTELNWIIILSSILMDSWSTNYMNFIINFKKFW